MIDTPGSIRVKEGIQRSRSFTPDGRDRESYLSSWFPLVPTFKKPGHTPTLIPVVLVHSGFSYVATTLYEP